MREGLFYLNNTGSKWVILPKQKIRLIHKAENYDKIRTIEFYSSFGNYAAVNLKYKGKMISILPDTDDQSNLIGYVDYKEKY